MILFKRYTDKFFIRVEAKVKKRLLNINMNANNIKKTSAFIKYKIKWNISPTGLQKCGDYYINLTN